MVISDDRKLPATSLNLELLLEQNQFVSSTMLVHVNHRKEEQFGFILALTRATRDNLKENLYGYNICFRDEHTRSRGGRVGSSLRQSFENGVDLLGNSCQGKFKLVLKNRIIRILKCLKTCKSATAAK